MGLSYLNTKFKLGLVYCWIMVIYINGTAFTLVYVNGLLFLRSSQVYIATLYRLYEQLSKMAFQEFYTRKCIYFIILKVVWPILMQMKIQGNLEALLRELQDHKI